MVMFDHNTGAGFGTGTDGNKLFGLLSNAGSYLFRVNASNAAGSGEERNYTIEVRQAPIGTTIGETEYPVEDYAQAYAPAMDFETGKADTISLAAGATVPYTGSPIAVRLKGKEIGGNYGDAEYTGLHASPRVWYRKTPITEESVWDLTAPTNAGSYELRVLYNLPGTNFASMPAQPGFQVLEAGDNTLTIDPTDLSDLITDDSVRMTFYIPAGQAHARLAFPLPYIERFGLKYTDVDAETAGTASGQNQNNFVIAGSDDVRAIVKDDSLIFAVDNSSRINHYVIARIKVENAEEGVSNVNIPDLGNNFKGIQVVIAATSADLLVETRPQIAINYLTEQLTNFANRPYSVNVGDFSIANHSSGANIAITAEMLGATASIVALPTGPFMQPSPAQTFAVPARRAAPTGLTAGDPGSNRIIGTTTAMEYRISGATTWTAASAGETVVPTHGSYRVRFSATSSSFYSEQFIIVLDEAGIAEDKREVKDPEETGVVGPVVPLSVMFTAGPNPVLRSSGSVAFFWQGKTLTGSTLSIFDAQGNLVSKVTLSAADAQGKVGSWNLKDSKGRGVSEGTYLVRGVMNTMDGGKERVTYKLSVR